MGRRRRGEVVRGADGEVCRGPTRLGEVWGRFSLSPRRADQFDLPREAGFRTFCNFPYKTGRLEGGPRARTAARGILGQTCSEGI